MKKARCPKWGCNGIGVPVETEKKFSFTKGVLGTALGAIAFGGVGAAIGATTGVGGKNGKTKFICNKCGRVFEKKI